MRRGMAQKTPIASPLGQRQVVRRDRRVYSATQECFLHDSFSDALIISRGDFLGYSAAMPEKPNICVLL